MNAEKKRRPIRKRVRALLLVIAATVMLLSDGLGILSIMRLQNAVEESLAQQLELNLYNTIADKAALADVEFGRYLDEVDGFAQYIHELYTHPEKHVFREVQPPRRRQRRHLGHPAHPGRPGGQPGGSAL